MNKFMILMIAMLLSACATIGSLQPGAGQRFLVESHSYNEIWNASVQAVGSSLTIIDLNEDGGVIKAEARAGIATWGEVVGVFITQTDNGHYVEVVSEKRSQLQLTGQNWETTIISLIQANLAD